MTLDLISWSLLASFVVHLLDETLVNGGFVGWVDRSFWPGYSTRMFFWFNAGAVVLIVVSNLLFDVFGGHLVILPLIWIFGFTLHGLTVHVFWTVRQRNYSPGLLTSVLYWTVAYFAIRYGYSAGLVTSTDFWTGVIVGCLLIGGFLTFGPTAIFPLLNRQAPKRR